MGDLRTPEEAVFTMSDVRKHTSPNDAWIVINNTVYDITNFWRKHPGGQMVIYSFVGMDATAYYNLHHLRKETVSDKYLKAYRKGTVKPDSISERKRLIDKDYKELTKICERLGFFKANYWHQVLVGIQVLFLIALSMLVVRYCSVGLIPTAFSALLLGIAWVLVTYSWHDFGHRGVTHDVSIDYFFQHILTNIVQGFCTEFIQIYHNLHHTFPHKTGGVLNTDAQGQHKEMKERLPIWKIILNIFTTAPFLFPYFWTLASIKHCIMNRSYVNLATFGLFNLWYFGFYYSHLGILYCLMHWVIARQFWSCLIFFTAIANHLDFPPDYEDLTFFEYQVSCSINFTKHWFVSWATGGQNEQIEHHLWPHMPRENFSKATPYVKALCRKWNVPYTEKPVFQAYKDMFEKLRKNANATRPVDMWYQTMYRTF